MSRYVPAIPGPVEAGVSNDWCITQTNSLLFSYYELPFSVHFGKGVHPDQTPQNAASDQDVHYLP